MVPYKAVQARRGITVFGDPAPVKTCPACLSDDLPPRPPPSASTAVLNSRRKHNQVQRKALPPSEPPPRANKTSRICRLALARKGGSGQAAVAHLRAVTIGSQPVLLWFRYTLDLVSGQGCLGSP